MDRLRLTLCVPNILGIFGFNNAPIDDIENPTAVSRIYRKGPIVYFQYVVTVFYCVMFILFAALISRFSFGVSATAVFLAAAALMLSLVVFLFFHRLLDGDTVALNEEGIWQASWLHRRLLRWEDIDKAIIYEKDIPNEHAIINLLKSTVISVKGTGGNISLTCDYSGLPELAAEISKRLGGRAEVRGRNLSFPITFLAIISALTISVVVYIT